MCSSDTILSCSLLSPRSSLEQGSRIDTLGLGAQAQSRRHGEGAGGAQPTMALLVGLWRSLLVWGLLVSGLGAIFALQLWSVGTLSEPPNEFVPFKGAGGFARSARTLPAVGGAPDKGCPMAPRPLNSKDAEKGRALEAVWKQWAPALAEPRAGIHVSTDKPVYRPGEKVFVRGVLVPTGDPGELFRRLSCAPSASWGLEVTSAQGEVLVSSAPVDGVNGVVAFQWLLPRDLPGGEYALKVLNQAWTSYMPSGVRKIQVRAFRNAKIRVKIDFLGSGYGPGDQVRARVGATRAVGGPLPLGTVVSVTATLDGGPWLPGPITAQLDDRGECTVAFPLPTHMREGLGTLTAVVEDGGVVESGSKTIPIVLQALALALFPEGGPLVEGVENRVYFEALSPTREPVDLEAELWAVGPVGATQLATVRAQHEGRGRFSLTPLPKHSYELRVTKPAGIAKSTALPAAEKEVMAEKGKGPLVALSLLQEDGSAAEGQAGSGPIRVQLRGTQEGTVEVGLFHREGQLDRVAVALPKAGEPVVVALSAGETGGVLRVTASTEDKVPIAERLVFQRPLEALQVELRPASQGAYPGALQRLHISVRDSHSKPVAGAVIGLTVTDKSTLGMVEDRKQPPRLPEMALLETEVEHLEDCTAYLGAGPEASAALDLLLGTQGWRRFAYADPLKKLEAMGPEATVSFTVGEEDKEQQKTERRERFERMMRLALSGKGLPGDLAGLSDGLGMPEIMPAGMARDMNEAMVQPMNLKMHLPMAARARMAARDDEAMDMAAVAEMAAMPEGGAVDEAATMEVLPEGMAGEGREAVEERGEAEAGAQGQAALAEGDGSAPVAADDAGQGNAGAMDLPMPAGMAMDMMGRRGTMPTSVRYERVYAHRRRAAAAAEGEEARRSDFTETVYWASNLVTDNNGEATAQFELSDAITSFAVLADAHTMPDSHLASSSWVSLLASHPPMRVQAFGASEEYLIQSQKPLTVDAKMPLELTAGDRVDLPISVVSSVPNPLRMSIGFAVSGGLEADLEAGQLEVSPGRKESGLQLADPAQLKGPKLLGAAQRARYVLPIRALSTAELQLRFNLSDRAVSESSPDAGLGSRSTEPQAITGMERMVEEVPTKDSAVRSERLEGVVAVEVEGRPKGQETSRKQLVPNLPTQKDAVQRTVTIAPAGFPAQTAFGGVLRPGQEAVGGRVLLPETTVNGTIRLEVVLYRSPVAQLTQALEALLQEPCGCFEQTSATVYPTLLAQQYFRSHGAEAAVVERSQQLLERGLARLRSFEVAGSGGYEWFGQAPAHEALTAYGLLEFVDLAKVFPVPTALVERTTAWLMRRKDDPQRTFQLNPAHLDGFGGAPPDITLAYIVWALTAAGVKEGLDPQLQRLREQASRSSDPYLTALVASSLFAVARPSEALPLARRLQKAQQRGGFLGGAQTSITSSWGESLLVETTALAVLTWLQETEEGGAEFADCTLRALEWLASRCQGGAFGSTQATVLALKAIMAYETKRAASASALRPGTAHLLVDGQRVASQPFPGAPASLQPLRLRPPSPSPQGPLLRAGREQRVELQMEGGSPMPYSVLVRYHATLPASSAECSVRLSVQLAREALQEGEMAEVEVRLTNQKDRPLPMVVAVVGLPGGLEVRHEQLQELVTRGVLPFYEVRGREVVLYWRTIPANAKLALRLEAMAAVPGIYASPASRAYEYYANEHKHWTEPLQCTISAKAARLGMGSRTDLQRDDSL